MTSVRKLLQFGVVDDGGTTKWAFDKEITIHNLINLL